MRYYCSKCNKYIDNPARLLTKGPQATIDVCPRCLERLLIKYSFSEKLFMLLRAIRDAICEAIFLSFILIIKMFSKDYAKKLTIDLFMNNFNKSDIE